MSEAPDENVPQAQSGEVHFVPPTPISYSHSVDDTNSPIRDATLSDAELKILESDCSDKPAPAVPPRIESVQAEPRRSRRPRESYFTYTTNTLLTLITILAVFLGFQRFLPLIVREVSYSYHHGKQQAEYELASQFLAEHPFSEFTSTFEAITKKAGPAVVHINVESRAKDGPLAKNDTRFRNPSGQGSGVIVDAEGYIVTNFHVVQGAKEIEVKLSDGRPVKAQLVGTDKESDLALLKIDAPNLVAADWGDSDSENEGSPVWAMGSPFGLHRSVTFGILSAKHRSGLAGNAYQDYLQTDAAVNPGNSGGPLVNSRGQVIGINTAILGDSYQGVSFSIPSNIAKTICNRLKSEGSVTRGWLGVELREVSEEMAKLSGLPSSHGALVANFALEKTPAEEAGIQPGDIVLEWNGSQIEDTIALIRKVAEARVGESAEVTVRRGQNNLKFKIAVGKRPTVLPG
jgi:serine protease Do